MDSLPDDARLRKLLADVAATPPYPGLRPFRPDEQRFFKGRKAQIEEVTARLTTEKCVVVHGGSGSGKSSLVRAGVIPALRLQSIPDRGDFWRAAICTPGQSPVGNLAAALDAVLSPAPTGGDRVGRVRDVLAGGDGLGGFMPAFRGEIPLEEGVSRTVLDKANLLVLVDQFEELFREENHGNPEAAWLAGLVVDAWRNRERYEGLYLVLTMRSEDLHRCAEFIELPNMINAAGYLTRRLEEKELREAIVAPVRPLLIRARLLASGGATGEADLRPFDVEVVTRLLDAAEEIAADPDHLPLLQHLLAVLWRTALRRWQDDGIGPNAEPGVEVRDLARAIGLESWEEAETARRTWETRQVDRGRDRLAGRGWLLRRGLENVAEALYRGLAAPDQRIARTSFCLMGVVDDRGSFKRRWTTLREIREVAAAPGLTLADPALKSFMAPDPFIRAEAEAKPEVERSLDVSHESLMRNWESLGDWLRRDREDGETMLDVRRAYLEQGDRWPASWLAANAPKVLGWVSPLRGHRLARARELPDRGYSPAWTERFKASEEDRPAVTEPGDGPTGAEPPFGALMAYVRGSKMRHAYRTQTRVLLCALGVCIVLAGLGAYALAVNWREAGKFSKLEARAFNAYSLADANDLPSYAGLPYERQIHGVHELALVHQALMTMKEPDSLTGRLLYRDRQMARERMAVSSRLADQLADRTSRGVLAAALWPVARTRAPVATPATDGACTPGRRITDFNNRDKIFSLIGAPADLPGLPGAAPGTKVQAGLLRSWREGETFVGLLQVRDGGCWPAALFRLKIAPREPLVAKPEGDPVPDVQDLRATPDLSLVIERNPAGQPAWGDRLFRVDWSVACRKRSQADPSCGGELSWVADPVEIGWFAQRSFRAAESGEFDALWDDRSAVDASEPRAQPMSVVAYDRPALLPPSAAAEAARLRFDDPRAVRRRADDPLVLLDSAGCAVGRLRPDLALTGWAELEAPGRSIVAYVASATEANKGDFELFNHWLRVVQVDRSGGCRGGEATAVAGFPIVEVGPFGAPPVAGIAFGPASGPLDQRLVIRHADPVGTYSAIPWSREALQATMCGILAASEGQGYPPDERYSSTAYRLLKGPEGSVFRELEGGHGVCPQQPLPHPRPVAFTTAGALASGDGSHDSTSKP